MAKESYVSNVAVPDPNTAWVSEKLAEDSASGCELESIIIFAQKALKPEVYSVFDDYFDDCGGAELPIITLTGDLVSIVTCVLMIAYLFVGMAYPLWFFFHRKAPE